MARRDPLPANPSSGLDFASGFVFMYLFNVLGAGGGLQESLPFYEVTWTRMPPPFLLTVLPVPWHRLHPWRLLPRSGWLNGELRIAPNLPARAGGWGQMSSSSSPLEVSPFCMSPAASPGQCPPSGDQRWVQRSDACWVAARSSGSSRPLVSSQPRLSLSHPKAKDADLRPSSSPRTRWGPDSGHGHRGCHGLGAFPGSQQQDQTPGRLAASPAGTSCPAQRRVAPRSASPPQQLPRARWAALLCCHR